MAPASWRQAVVVAGGPTGAGREKPTPFSPEGRDNIAQGAALGNGVEEDYKP